MTEKKRYTYIDIAKGLGMLAVIWGHILISGRSWIFVYSFDIPLFFFLSGMMYNQKKYTSFGKFFMSRVKSLLIPYAVISAATWALWAVFSLLRGGTEDYFGPLLQTVIAQGSAGYMVHNVPLWFVTCLFVTEILYFFIARLPDVLNLIVCLLTAVIGYFMLNNGLAFDFTKLPWNVESAMSAMLFYGLGNLFVKHSGINGIGRFTSRHRAASAIIWLGLTAVTAVASQFNGHVSIGSNSLGNNVFLFYVIGLCGTFAVLVFSELCAGRTRKPAELIVRGVRFIGKNSFYFMAFHVPVKGVISVVVAKLFRTDVAGVSKSALLSAVVFVPTLVCTSAAVYCLCFVKRRIKKMKERSVS